MGMKVRRFALTGDWVGVVVEKKTLFVSEQQGYEHEKGTDSSSNGRSHDEGLLLLPEKQVSVPFGPFCLPPTPSSSLSTRGDYRSITFSFTCVMDRPSPLFSATYISTLCVGTPTSCAILALNNRLSAIEDSTVRMVQIAVWCSAPGWSPVFSKGSAVATPSPASLHSLRWRRHVDYEYVVFILYVPNPIIPSEFRVFLFQFLVPYSYEPGIWLPACQLYMTSYSLRWPYVRCRLNRGTEEDLRVQHVVTRHAPWFATASKVTKAQA